MQALSLLLLAYISAAAALASTAADWKALMPAFLRRVAQCNGPVAETPPLTPFFVDGVRAGDVAPPILEALRDFPAVFAVTNEKVSLCADGTFEERNEAVNEVALALRDRGLLTKWRDETLALTTRFDAPAPLLLIERRLNPLLGGKGFGVAVNGWCTEPATGEQMLWVATRADDKATWPGMLDALAAGALAAGNSPLDAARREAAEEAGVSAQLAAAAMRPVGAVSYRGVDESPTQPKDDVFFCFDIELPWDFAPLAVDGEVSKFERMPVAEVARAVAYGQAPGWPCPALDGAGGTAAALGFGALPLAFKPNINLVVLDWLVRHGHVPPDSPGYLELVAGLRQGECC